MGNMQSYGHQSGPPRSEHRRIRFTPGRYGGGRRVQSERARHLLAGSVLHEPYYSTDYTYDDYAPAYRTGYEAAGRYQGQNKRFDDLEPELRANYERIKGKSRLAWENAKDAVRAAWHRVERIMPGDFDNDGR